MYIKCIKMYNEFEKLAWTHNRHELHIREFFNYFFISNFQKHKLGAQNLIYCEFPQVKMI